MPNIYKRMLVLCHGNLFVEYGQDSVRWTHRFQLHGLCQIFPTDLS